RRAHRQRDDVEAASGEQTRDACEHAELVLDENGQDVVVVLRRAVHQSRPPGMSCAGSRITSSLDEPAGTIGYTFSRWSVRKSVAAGGSSVSFAFSMVGTPSSGVSHRMPMQPIASAHFT